MVGNAVIRRTHPEVGARARQAQWTRRSVHALTAMAVVCGVLVLATSEAHACSCVTPSPLRQRFDAATVVLYGHAVAQDLQIGDPPNPFTDRIAHTVAVDQVVKGDPTPTIVLETGVHGGVCGTTLPPGPFALVAAAPEADGSFSMNLCERNVMPIEQVEALMGNLPEEGGRSPPSVLVRADLGDVSLVSMDSTGRVVGYGRDPDVGRDLSPCPGGTKVLASFFGGPARQPAGMSDSAPFVVNVIDVATLRVESSRRFPVPDGFGPAGVQCLDPGGHRSAMTVSRTTYPVPGGSSVTTEETLVEADGVIKRSFPDLSSVSFDPARNVLMGRSSRLAGLPSADPYRRSLELVVSVDLGSGETTIVHELEPGLARMRLAFSPGFERVVVPVPVAEGSDTFGALAVIQLSTGHTSPISLPTPRRSPFISWPDGERILLTSWDSANAKGSGRVDLWFTGGVLTGSNDSYFTTLAGNDFWSISNDGPQHPAVRIKAVPARAGGRFVLSGAFVHEIVRLQRPPLAYVLPPDVAAAPVRATPSFTG